MPSIASLTRLSRNTGSRIPTGSGATSCASRLPSAPRSSAVRIDTGTAARGSRPSVRSPREWNQRCSAPATTARTTSLTVPPNASLTSLNSDSRALATSKRRCGPMRTLSGVSGGGLSPAQTTSPRPSSASRACSSSRGARARARSGAVAALRSDSAASSAPVGSGRGCQASGAGEPGGSRSRSNSTVARSTPEIPSTSE